jgi:capsular polysaccharide biosynthesis protein
VEVDADICRCRSLVVPAVTSVTGQALLGGFYQTLADLATTESGTQHNPAPDLVYISRGGAAIRRVVTTAFEDKLRTLGFTVCRPEDMSFAEQVKLFRSARVIVASHGAALANAVFCRQGTTIVEILSSSDTARGRIFRAICSLNKLEHILYIGRATSIRSNGDADIDVDSEQISALVNSLKDRITTQLH